MQRRDYIRSSDFESLELEGTTNAVADTSSQFRHGRGKVPSDWQVLEGQVYIPADGAGPNTIDVRSASESETFRIILFF